ncbi:MAG: M3 family peptidase, partial [Bacteroidetes bacterium]|nr:M3 family peptidase [Bacteroidota bacterium]
MTNPLLSTFDTPFESAPFDIIKTEHFVPAIDKLIAEADKEILEIANNPEIADFENTIDALELNGELLGRVVEVLYNLNHAETSEELQQIAQIISPKLSDFSSRLLMNQ